MILLVQEGASILAEASKATAVVGLLVAVSFVAQHLLRKAGLFKWVDEAETKAGRIGNILTLVASFLFILSGVGKVAGFPPMVEKFTLFGMLEWFPYVGMIEIIVGILLMIPNTSKLGVLGGVATAGGAIATHMPIHSDGLVWAIPSSTYMAFVLLSSIYAKPEMWPDYITGLFHKA